MHGSDVRSVQILGVQAAPPAFWYKSIRIWRCAVLTCVGPAASAPLNATAATAQIRASLSTKTARRVALAFPPARTRTHNRQHMHCTTRSQGASEAGVPRQATTAAPHATPSQARHVWGRWAAAPRRTAAHGVHNSSGEGRERARTLLADTGSAHSRRGVDYAGAAAIGLCVANKGETDLEFPWCGGTVFPLALPLTSLHFLRAHPLVRVGF